MANINTGAPAAGARVASATRLVDLGATITRIGGWPITAALAVIFLWFGTLKFLPLEQLDLVGIVSNNPLISWLYNLFGVAGGARFLGVFELITGFLIAGRLIHPRLSALGGAMGVWSFCLTHLPSPRRVS